MRITILFILSFFLMTAIVPETFSQNKPAHSTTHSAKRQAGQKLGTVHFPVSCNEAANHHTTRALALYHHMSYEDAEAEFAAAMEKDPDCSMAYWGQAHTYIHPIWSDPPNEEKFKKGQSLMREAKTRGKKTDREQAYIDATDAYYSKGLNRKEAENLVAFAEAWEKVHQQFPDDLEASCLFAIAYLGSVDPADKTFTKQKRAGEIAEKVIAKDPTHPGGHHYLIHAYDVPPLAEKGLGAARNYGKIAPEVPHALHMPTHIFTRLGLWEESISWNKRSAEAALHHPMGDAISLHHLHALDYLAYAYLQLGQDENATEILKQVQGLKGPFVIEVAVPYTLAAVPARLALERKQWEVAAKLEPRMPQNFPWEKFPAMEAITHFARALGAARTGDIQKAEQAIETLKVLETKAAETSGYWDKQVEIQRVTATAWLNLANGKKEEALTMMRKAADLEGATEKHPVTPGEILPARELLADMLLEMGKNKEAQAEYESTLIRCPNRLNSLRGAGRAAQLAGKKTSKD